MTNEWVEFKAYTEQPTYTAVRKTDTTYLGRFTFDMITEFSGFGRILTIIARGYLFHDKDGSVLNNPYERIEIARKALYAWCSVSDKKKSSEPPVDFRELSADFPELVDENGKGWFYRHIRSVIRFVKANPDKAANPHSKSARISLWVLRHSGKRECVNCKCRSLRSIRKAHGRCALTISLLMHLKQDH